VRERGYPGLEVDQLVARANVSRKTFYELLESREQCFQIVLEDTVMRLGNVLRDAFAAAEPSPSWTSLRAALRTLLAFIEDEPGLGTALIVDTLGAGPSVRAYRARVLNEIAAIVDRVRTRSTESKNAKEPLPHTTEWVLAGALGLIQSRLVENRPLLTDLLNPLMALTVLPYAGRSAAARQLHHPDLGMRITHRRLLVLAAIAQTPGSLSREVAEAAAVKSEAQASRMLARLEQLGVIENTTGSRISGRPKAWRLTELGEQIWQGLRGREVGGDEPS
jgi:AcrR family transcriptional regulator